MIHPGDTLVSNFNDASNVQGTGTTIVDISPSGSQSVFFQNPNDPGLSTTLGILQRGFVLVGNTPATVNSDGNLVPTSVGSLLILDRHGNVVATLSNPTLLNGPWGLTVNDLGGRAQVFVDDVYSGTVTRIDLSIPPAGTSVGQLSVDSAQGAAFGLAISATRHRLTLAAVNDGANTLDLRSMSF